MSMAERYQEVLDNNVGTHRIVWTSAQTSGYQDGLPMFTSEAEAMQEAERLQEQYRGISMRCYVEEI